MKKCTKRKYKDKISVMFALSQCNKHSAKSNRQECRFYWCDKCKSYHLTKKKFYFSLI